VDDELLIDLSCASKDFNAGIGIAEMLGQSNYLAIVGGGKNPKFPQNKVIYPFYCLRDALELTDYLSWLFGTM
jgi:hypothetical protein